MYGLDVPFQFFVTNTSVSILLSNLSALELLYIEPFASVLPAATTTPIFWQIQIVEESNNAIQHYPLLCHASTAHRRDHVQVLTCVACVHRGEPAQESFNIPTDKVLEVRGNSTVYRWRLFQTVWRDVPWCCKSSC